MGASFSLEDGENGERMEESASRLLIHSELTQEYKDATHAVIAECFDELVVTFGGGLLTKFTLNEEEFDSCGGAAFRQLSRKGSDHPRDGPMANVFHVFCALFLLSQEELHSLDTKIDEIHTLFDFDKSGGLNRDGMVSFDEFADAILPWISFGVVDDDGTGELSPDELKLLIWISGGDNTPEPSAQVVLQAMRGVDVNKDGVLEIKEIFAKEIGVALENMESEAHCCFSQSSRDALQVLMMNAGNEVADLIDEDHSGMIEWDEFYAHSATIAAKQEKIREYAKVLLVQDMRERPEARRPRASVMVRNPSSKSAKKSGLVAVQGRGRPPRVPAPHRHEQGALGDLGVLDSIVASSLLDA
ncbi:hypothetical protein JL722_14780 [Aureococcus anophagefferens]|nr:hypothetical protein JL722_14780 [Aureococcus anophagefferens]